MNIKAQLAAIVAAAVVTMAVAPAIPAEAQSRHRQKTKNDWRNASIAGGALTAAGLLTHNNTLTAVGAAGGLYSLSRYEHDRKSQSREDHERARMYERSSYRRGGHTYTRRVVHRNGKSYYQYVRH